MADVEKLNINNTDYDIADAVAREKIQDIEAARFPNAIIIGEPTITQGQISGFSADNYLQFPFLVDLANRRFTIKFCFTTADDVTTQQNILDSQFGLALAIANGKGLMAISHNGTSWAGSVVGTKTIDPNTTYYAELSWNRINYQTKLSTDGTTYVADMNFGSTQSPYPRTMFIGGCSGTAIGHTAHPFKGTINFNKCYLFIEDVEVWQGMDDVGLATRADVSLDNLDARGEARFAAKQDVLTAGTNITIEDNVISATSSVPEGVMINKSTGTKSIVENNSGNASYPTTTQTYSTVIGHGAYINGAFSNNTIYGYNAYALSSYVTAIGSSAYGNASGTSVGAFAYSTSYSAALGYNARASYSYSTALGYSAAVTGGNYGVAVGYNAQGASSYAVAVGASSRAYYYSAALGYGASASASQAVQLGNGGNNVWGSLQFRDYQLLDGEGKIPVDRLPKEALAGGDTVVNLYELPQDDNKHVVYQYTGTTNPLFTSNYFYRSEVRYTYPLVTCTWVTGGDYVPNKEDVTIDQEAFFKQLVRVTRERKDDGEISQGIMGGGYSEMSMYFYYNGTDQEWRIEFGDDNIEGHQSPDSVEGITDLTQWGIYLNDVVTLPGEDEEEEMFDVRYQAPLYFESYDYNSDSFVIDYEQLLSGLDDGDWGIGYVASYGEYSVDVDGTDVWVPLLPKAYYDGDEEMIFRFEWDSDNEEWSQYINGNYIGYDWSTQNLGQTFGIYVGSGDESDVEYIEFALRPARQLYWEYCNPIDTSMFVTAEEGEDFENRITALENSGASVKELGDVDPNTLYTQGVYHISGINGGVQNSVYKNHYPFVTYPVYVLWGHEMWIETKQQTKINTDYAVQTIYFPGTYQSVSGASRHCPLVFRRSRVVGNWGSWQLVLSSDDTFLLPGYVYGTKQKLVHNASSTALTWVADDGGSGGTTDYDDLDNKPQIGGVELSGDKSLDELGIQPAGEYASKATYEATTKTLVL